MSHVTNPKFRNRLLRLSRSENLKGIPHFQLELEETLYLTLLYYFDIHSESTRIIVQLL